MHTSLNTEQQILSELAAGKRAATESVYKQHHNIVVHWINNHGGTVADAEDIFQEAMVVLFEKAQSEDFRLTCRIGTYLFAVSKHLWYKKIQQLQKQPSSLPESGESDDPAELAYEDDITSHHEREAHYEQLYAAMEQLGEPCRSLLQAYYHKDKSMQEIAADFGYTNPDNAKTQKYKCLTRLRKLFYGVQAKW
ncbi:MAG: sigma-70 family RNA polymerase sigma factor [Bacteroidota bacterium]